MHEKYFYGTTFYVWARQRQLFSFFLLPCGMKWLSAHLLRPFFPWIRAYFFFCVLMVEMFFSSLIYSLLRFQICKRTAKIILFQKKANKKWKLLIQMDGNFKKTLFCLDTIRIKSMNDQLTAGSFISR